MDRYIKMDLSQLLASCVCGGRPLIDLITAWYTLTSSSSLWARGSWS